MLIAIAALIGLLVGVVLFVIGLVKLFKKKPHAFNYLFTAALLFTIFGFLFREFIFSMFNYSCGSVRYVILMDIQKAQLAYKDDPSRGRGHYAANMESLGLDWADEGVVNESPLILGGGCRFFVQTNPEYSEVISTRENLQQCYGRLGYDKKDEVVIGRCE